MESSEIEIDLHIYVQLIISKHARKFNGEGIVFFNKWCWKNSLFIGKTI